jgi:hypothetical protein
MRLPCTDFAVPLSFYTFVALQQADLFIVQPADLNFIELINEIILHTLSPDCFSLIV